MLRCSLLAVIVALSSFAVPTAALAGPGSGGGKPTETRVEGTVVAVNAAAGSVSIRTQGGAVVVVTAAAGTKVERNGVRATVAQFKVGDRGQARLTGGAATKLEATGV